MADITKEMVIELAKGFIETNYIEKVTGIIKHGRVCGVTSGIVTIGGTSSNIFVKINSNYDRTIEQECLEIPFTSGKELIDILTEYLHHLLISNLPLEQIVEECDMKCPSLSELQNQVFRLVINKNLELRLPSVHGLQNLANSDASATRLAV